MASVRKRKWTYKGVAKEAWIVDYAKPDGSRGHETFRTKKEAIAYRTTVEVEIRDGIHVAKAASATMREATEEFMRDCDRRHRIGDDMSGYTVRNYMIFAKKIIERFGGRLISEFSTTEAQSWIDDLSEKYKKKTVLRAKLVLNEIIKLAVRRGWVRRNVLVDNPVKMPSVPNTRVRIPSRSDILALLEAVERPASEWQRYRNHLTLRAMVHMGIFAGMLRGEMAGLQWEDVDFENNVINVRQSLSSFDGLKSPKTEAGVRTIPMVASLKDALLALRDYWGLREEMYDERSPSNTLGYFTVRIGIRVKRGDKPKPGRIMSGPVLRIVRVLRHGKGPNTSIPKEWGYGRAVCLADMGGNYWRTIMTSAGLTDNGKPRFTMHAMRHAAASLLIESGLPAFNLKALMGHSSVQTTYGVYGHLFADDNRSEIALNSIASDLAAARAKQSAPTI